MSDHVAHLHSMVGSTLLHLPSVAVICRDERVLLVHERDSGLWSTPGGDIEPGESPEEAVQRERRDETGAAVRVDRLVTAVGGPGFHKIHSNGDRLSFVSLIFEGAVQGGTLLADGDETTELGWFAPSELDGFPQEDFPPLPSTAPAPLSSARRRRRLARASERRGARRSEDGTPMMNATGGTRMATPDPYPDYRVDEVTTLTQFLDFHRAQIVGKVSDLADEEASARVLPATTITAGGIVKHLACVEDSWFQAVFLGRPLPEPWASAPPERDRDWPFRSSVADPVTELVELYGAACARSRAVAAEVGDLDALAKEQVAGRGAASLRWVLVHMIEETARHAGHLDLLRDAIELARPPPR